MAKRLASSLIAGLLFVGNGLCSWRAAELLSYVDKDSSVLPPGTDIQINPGANVTTLKAEFFPEHNSKRVELKYGPFNVPSMAVANGMYDYMQLKAQMPCNDCMITYMHASLEYPNGTYANANTSLWLHHVLLINLNHPDTVCGKHYYGRGERWFASGNERTPADICDSGKIPTGYYLGDNDYIVLVLELMNQAMYDQTAVLTITSEYIEGQPEEFYSATPIWMDISGCHIPSDMPVKSNTTFMYQAPTWKSDLSGIVTGMGGHLHDGGTHLEIIRNNDEVCNSVAYYGQTPGYWDVPGSSMFMPMVPNFSPMAHISSISGCLAPASAVQPGDEWTIKAYYNFTEYTPMMNTDGSFTDIMGISLIYVAQDMTWEKMGSYVGTKVPPLAITPAPTSVAYMPMPMKDDGDDDDDMEMTMICKPNRDSPGTITTSGLNMANTNIAMAYLMAILNDACLQAWSKPYAEGFWYGIIAVILLFTVRRVVRSARLNIRKRNSAANKSGNTNTLGAPASLLSRTARWVSYPQMAGDTFRGFVRDDAVPKISQVSRMPPSGTIALVVSYFGFLLLLQFLNASTGDDQTAQFLGVRAAWLSVAQIPLIIVLANKRNLVGLFTGITYERLNVLHRWTARGLLMTASMHFGFQSYGWARAGVMQLEWNSDECPPTGMAAYALVLWMNLSTLAPFRNMCYELFVAQHIITFMGLIVAVAYHIPTTALDARDYIYVAAALYLVSRLVQMGLYAYHNVRPARATATSISEGVTQLSITSHRLKSWTPGSFVLVSVPRHGVFQSHPFTIASVPQAQSGELTFFLKKHKGFTSKIAKGSSDAIALLDGPYGGQHSDMAAFPNVVLIAGSTGVSFVLPILLNIADRAATSRLPVREIHLVWATKDRDFASFLTPQVKHAVERIVAAGIIVTAAIHVTDRASSLVTDKSETSSNSDASSRGQSDIEKKDYVQTRAIPIRTDSSTSSNAEELVTRHSGRPHLKRVLEAAHAKSTVEMAVAVCGPKNMSSETRNIVSTLNRRGPADVYLHVEGFSW